MSLKTLNTNLKSLRFGNDRPGGGSSNQPYIISHIPEGDEPGILSTGGPDFLLRGGILAPIRAAEDVSRLTKMFFDLKSPNGLLFTVKQNLLSRTAVKTEASYGIGYGGGAVNAGIYTPLSTLGQAASGFAGAHLNLLGLDPTGLTGLGLKDYETVVKNNNKGDGSPANRLVVLATGYTSPNLGFIKGVTANDGNILEYGGGPGSILGIGKTYIPFADQRTGTKNSELTNSGFFATKEFGYYDYSVFKKPRPTIYLGSKIFNGAGLSSLYENSTGIDLLQFQFKVDNETPGNIQKFNPSVYKDKFLTESNNLKTYQTKRWNSKTTGSFISPLGASIEYQSLGSFKGELKTDFLITGSGYTWENKEASKATSGSLSSLTPSSIPQKKVNTIINYTGSVPSGSINGISSKYSSLSGDKVNNGIDYSLNIRGGFNPSVYNNGSFEPNTTDVIGKYGDSTYTQQQLIEQKHNNTNSIQDFKTILLKGKSSSYIMSKSPDYNEKNIEKRVGLGNPGTKKDVYNYATGGNFDFDKITASDFHNDIDHSGPLNDLVKFSIGIVQPDKTWYMNFRSLIDSFSDAYTATWNDVKYVGRGDKFYNYEGFDRKISLGFTVYAQSKAELIPIYKKLNYLASSLAPSYTEGGFMRGNLARLTIGGYLFNQLGVITGFTYNIPEESTWEIGIDISGGDDPTVKELPHMIKVTGFSFTPIHEFLPRTAEVNNQKDTRYIALSKTTGNSKSNYEITPKFVAGNTTPGSENIELPTS